jgi:hypothetical protein
MADERFVERAIGTLACRSGSNRVGKRERQYYRNRCKEVEAMRRPIIVGVCALCVVGTAIAADEKPDKTKSPADRAKVVLIGTLCCAQCDASIAGTCATALRVDKEIVVIEGRCGEELFDQRRDGVLRRIAGHATAKAGVLYLESNSADEPKKQPDAKLSATVVGRLVDDAGKLAIDDAKQRIYITGKAAAVLKPLVGKPVRVVGVLSVKDQDHIVLDAQKGEHVERKKKPPKPDKPEP